MTHTAPTVSAQPAAQRPSDDEILGLVPDASSPAVKTSGPNPSDLDSPVAEKTSDSQQAALSSDPSEFRAIFESNPALRDAWRDAKSFREIFPTVEDARAASSHSSDLAKLDALFFSQDPQSHAALAQALRTLNPAAFKNLAQAMQDVANTHTTAGDGVQASPQSGRSSTLQLPTSVTEGRTSTAPQEAAVQDETQFTAAHEHAFFHETNAAAVQGVLQSIQSQLERLLPEGTPQNTRNRLTGEIYREVDAALQSNRAFGQQLRQAFRSGQLTPENQRAIVAMVIGRAKQTLPGITKRVLSEWTSGVLAHANARQERQRQASKRVDIAGGAPGNDAPRALMPKDIDYRRMSDNDILNL